LSDIRAFIAIELPSQIHCALDQIIRQMQGPKTRAVRWVPANNIHLTMKFLGTVKSDNLQNIVEVIKDVVISFTDFEIQAGNFGVFPNPRKPRLIWIGIQGPQNLSNIQKAIDLATRPLGYPGEDRPFFPHLTVGRVSQYASFQEVQDIAQLLTTLQVGKLGVAKVDAITLFRSDLFPTGAVYKPLAVIKLSKLT
jgi:RNA 2',3'-cyclic 3'-phosphodiesterase